jgi:hypothetical protein
MTLKEAKRTYQKTHKQALDTLELLIKPGHCQADHVEDMNEWMRTLFHCSEKIRSEE